MGIVPHFPGGREPVLDPTLFFVGNRPLHVAHAGIIGEETVKTARFSQEKEEREFADE